MKNRKLENTYNPQEFEEKLYEKWEETRQYCRASQKTSFFRFCCHGP